MPRLFFSSNFCLYGCFNTAFPVMPGRNYSCVGLESNFREDVISIIVLLLLLCNCFVRRKRSISPVNGRINSHPHRLQRGTATSLIVLCFSRRDGRGVRGVLLPGKPRTGQGAGSLRAGAGGRLGLPRVWGSWGSQCLRHKLAENWLCLHVTSKTTPKKVIRDAWQFPGAWFA